MGLDRYRHEHPSRMGCHRGMGIIRAHSKAGWQGLNAQVLILHRSIPSMGVIIKYRAAVVPVEPVAQGEEVEPPALDALPPQSFLQELP